MIPFAAMLQRTPAAIPRLKIRSLAARKICRATTPRPLGFSFLMSRRRGNAVDEPRRVRPPEELRNLQVAYSATQS